MIGETYVARGGRAKRRGRADILDVSARDALVLGAYDPVTPDVVGINAGVTLQSVYGETQFTVPNQVIFDTEFWGRVYIAATATDLIFVNCAFRSIDPGTGTSATGASVVGQSGNLRGALFLDCDFIIPEERRDVWTNNIVGGNFTVRRCELSGGADGIGLTMPSTVPPGIIEQSWIHDGHWETWAAGTPNKPTFSDLQNHSDAIQLHRGAGHRIRGNHLGGRRQNAAVADRKLSDDFNNATIMCQQEVSSSTTDLLTDVLIELNYIEGGAAAVNFGYKFGNALTGVTCRDNTFPALDWSPPTYYILRNAGATPVLSGNVRRYPDGTTNAAPIGP